MTSRGRIAITSPYRWPWVRRGAERLFSELAHYLVQNQYEVETYATGPKERCWEDSGILHHELRARWHSKRRQLNDLHYFAWALQAKLKNSQAEAVHCLTYFDAYAALCARKRFNLNYKVVFNSGGIPMKRYFRAVPLDAWFFRQVLMNSDEVLVVSSFAASILKREFNFDAKILPPPVDTESIVCKGDRSSIDNPVILFVGDLTEPRKGAAYLCAAMPEILKSHPGAELRLSGHFDNDLRKQILMHLPVETCNRIKFLGIGKIEDLPKHYAAASVTVLPAVWEAFGMVLLESLAAGTPIVGTNHGGIPDVMGSANVGVLFEPGRFDSSIQNTHALAQAVSQVVSNPPTTYQCRQRAEQFSWQRLGRHYIALYGGESDAA